MDLDPGLHQLELFGRNGTAGGALGCAQPKLPGCFLQGNAFQVQALWRNIHFIIPDDRMVCHASLHEQLALFQHLKRGIGQVGRHIKLPMAYLKGSIL